MDLTPEDIASVDSAYWARLKKIRLQSGYFDFSGREYQIEPMQSKARRICYMKGTQGGFTEIEVQKTLHGLIYFKFPKGVLYMFPTSDDVREFSQSRFNPLIESNPLTIGKYVKVGGKGTDSATLKKIHDSFLYLRGARLSQKRSDDEMESSKLRGIPVDCCVFDEMDLMDPSAISKGRGRMGDSSIKREVYISNPGVPGEGIDEIFGRSDQRHWFRKCPKCNEWTCAELSFPDCVKIRPDGTGFIGCMKCGHELPIWNGDGSAEWVPGVPSNSDYMHGYNWSQLTSANNDPAEILEEYTNPPEGNLTDIIKLRLGQPYIAEEDRLTSTQVFSRCGPNMSPHSHGGPCAMGVDVGKIKHVVIGIRTSRDSYEILKTVQVSEWNDIHDLARRFNVKSAVIDIRPYEDKAREFQKAERYRIFLCEYKENTSHETLYNQKTGIVSVNRTEVFDATHRLITTEGRLILPRRDLPETKEFAKQVCNAYKLLEKNKKTNQSVYRYKGSNEHFRNALNYFLLAASRNHIGISHRSGIKRKKEQKYAVNNFRR